MSMRFEIVRAFTRRSLNWTHHTTDYTQYSGISVRRATEQTSHFVAYGSTVAFLILEKDYILTVTKGLLELNVATSGGMEYTMARTCNARDGWKRKRNKNHFLEIYDDGLWERASTRPVERNYDEANDCPARTSYIYILISDIRLIRISHCLLVEYMCLSICLRLTMLNNSNNKCTTTDRGRRVCWFVPAALRESNKTKLETGFPILLRLPWITHMPNSIQRRNQIRA